MIARLALHHRASLVVLAGLLAAVPAAAAPVEASVELSTRLGYDLNPFLTTGNDLASPYVESSIEPKLTKRTEKGEMSVSGHFTRTAYLEKYGKSDDYGAEASVQQRVTPKLSVFAALHYDSSVIGQGNDDVTGSSPLDNTDVNLIGLRQRTDTYSASGGWQYQVGPKDTVSADGGYTATRYRDAGGTDSNSVGGRIGWQHAVSERTKVGVSGAVYRIDYPDTANLSTLIMEPRVTFSTKLNAAWTFDASLGVSFSELTLPLQPDRSTKGLSGSASLCHKGSRDDFCLFANRSVSASGLGTVERTSAGGNYSRKLTERLGFAMGGTYSRSEAQGGISDTRQYVSTHAGFEWRASRQIIIGTEARYRDVFGGPPIKADLGGEIYMNVALPGTR
ncbi:hypothetical protein ASE00_10990 [Sphingomonas sp. Root710]|uniref:hypothetical protein n=1 Tax=Sphingomonas sp. Root710 TaxID=1736594 RepID=UPI000714193D|nr:hypothetical protein [Sphingomonas sp. Root710]KRB82568.1 hypothetical protein ASE00_10990 [Sphingomonas sp. Root710]